MLSRDLVSVSRPLFWGLGLDASGLGLDTPGLGLDVESGTSKKW
jgi:hypothetical protein